MQLQAKSVTYLPLARRTRLVWAFAYLIRALPARPPKVRLQEVPDYLRNDLGLPHAAPGRGSVAPPVWLSTLF